MPQRSTSTAMLALLMLVLGLSGLQAATYTINYTLSTAGRVSMNVYDANGAIVREIAHAAQRPAGANSETWDGLDSNGNSLAAGSYTWKLLETPAGLQAQYLCSPGGSYTPGCYWWSQDPGCHGGATGLAVDGTGMYIGASCTENIETSTLKQSLDGTSRIWSAQCPASWTGASSMASTNNVLYLLGTNYIMYLYAADTGASQGNYALPSATSGSNIDMRANGSTLVVSSSLDNWVKFLNPANGTVLATATVSAPQGVAVAGNGTVYVSTGASIVTITQSNLTPVTFAGGLTAPGRLDIDASNNSVVVYDGGASQQVKRFNSAGTLVNSYGAAGGRTDGLYVATNFGVVTDIVADGSGGFLVSEEANAPRRVAHFDSNGNLLKEWYGGQQWSTWISPEPPATEGDDPSAVWVMSAWGTFMRLTIDWSTNTWQIHSIYTQNGLASGLFGMSYNGEYWVARRANGNLYLCHGGASPQVIRVDTTNWKLLPVVFANASNTIWTDLNGDGVPTQNEWSNGIGSYPTLVDAIYYDENLNCYAACVNGSTNSVIRWTVTSFNACGAPVYGDFPAGTTIVSGSNYPARDLGGDNRWHRFICWDSTSNSLYAAINSNVPANGFNLNQDNFLQKWDSNGNEVWQTGQKGWFAGGVSAFRRFIGTSHGCTVVNDFNAAEGTGAYGVRTGTYVWDQDGLWVGSALEEPDVSSTPAWRYRLCEGDANIGEIFTNPTTGNTLFFGSWINSGRVFRITGWDNWTRQNGTVTIGTPSTAQTGQGLRAEYFNNPDLTSPADVRVDGPINFNWGNFSPDANLTNANAYSVRWSGTLTIPYGPSYLFMTPYTDGGMYQGTAHQGNSAGGYCQFVFHGTSVQWVWCTWYVGGYADVYLDGVLQAHNVDCYSSATLYNQVLWQTSGLPNTDHTLKLVITGQANPSASDCRVGVDYFVVDGLTIDDSGMAYTFYVNSCDGAHLWLDNNLLINDWRQKSSPSEASTTYQLLQGLHPLRLDYYHNGDPSTIALSWAGAYTSKQVIPAGSLFPVLDRFDLPRDVTIELPGTIQCEDFDGGGEGVGYHCLSAGNNPWSLPAVNYRPGTPVCLTAIGFDQSPDIAQLEMCNTMMQAYAGEWYNYSVNVLQNGSYSITARVGTNWPDNTAMGQKSGGQFHIAVDGVNVSGTLTIPSCSYTNPFALLTVSGVSLTSGLHTVTLNVDTNATGTPQVAGFFDSLQFNLQSGPCDAPTFTPTAGTYESATMVSISSETNGAAIRYTTDGSTPSETAGTIYSSPVNISMNTTLQAIAYNTGMSDSTITAGLFRSSVPVRRSAWRRAPYTCAQTVTISTSTSGATIRYTTDGRTPSETAGTIYSSAVNINVNTTLQAIAYMSGMADSSSPPECYTVQRVTPPLTGLVAWYSGQNVPVGTTTMSCWNDGTVNQLNATGSASYASSVAALNNMPAVYFNGTQTMQTANMNSALFLQHRRHAVCALCAEYRRECTLISRRTMRERMITGITTIGAAYLDAFLNATGGRTGAIPAISPTARRCWRSNRHRQATSAG